MYLLIYYNHYVSYRQTPKDIHMQDQISFLSLEYF